MCEVLLSILGEQTFHSDFSHKNWARQRRWIVNSDTFSTSTVGSVTESTNCSRFTGELFENFRSENFLRISNSGNDDWKLNAHVNDGVIWWVLCGNRNSTLERTFQLACRRRLSCCETSRFAASLPLFFLSADLLRYEVRCWEIWSKWILIVNY